jgi:aspartyl-tRNA(Asn)/glutamyl-tRNA(Gln) amidotransferase subunit C
MEIDKALISKLEHLARLELSEEESFRIMEDLNNILTMVEKLQELDTEGVDPLVYINEDENVLRADEVRSQLSRAEALKNAPDHDGEHIKVPKVIDL